MSITEVILHQGSNRYMLMSSQLETNSSRVQLNYYYYYNYYYCTAPKITTTILQLLQLLLLQLLLQSLFRK